MAPTPGQTRESVPPEDARREASRTARRAQAGGGALAGGGVGVEGAKQAGTLQNDQSAVVHPLFVWSALGLGIAVVIVAGMVIARQHRLVEQAWTGVEQKVPWLEAKAVALWRRITEGTQ